MVLNGIVKRSMAGMSHIANVALSNIPYKFNPKKLINPFIGQTKNAKSDTRNQFGRRLSMNVIERSLKQAGVGSMQALTDVAYETIDTDTHLASVLQKRFRAIGTLPIEIRPAKGSGVDKEKASFYAELVRNQVENIPFLRNKIQQVAWGLFHGRVVHELKWDYADGDMPLVVSDLTWIHPRRLNFGSRRELRILAEGQRSYGSFADVGISLYPDDLRRANLWRKFMWWTPQLFNEYPEREGLAPRCLYWSFFKRFAARERMILVELFGKPWRIVKVDENSNASTEDLEDAADIVDALGDTYTARLPHGVSLQVEKPGERSARTHREIIEDSDKQISKLVLGQTGTTDGVAAGLNANIGDVMSDEQSLLLAGDAFDVSEVLQEGLIKAMIEVNFGASELVNAPHIMIRADRPADRNTELDRLNKALDNGLDIDLNEAYEVSGFSHPEPGATVIRIEQPATPPGSPNPPPPRPVMIFPPGKAPDPGVQLLPAPSTGTDNVSNTEDTSPDDASNTDDDAE